LAAAGMTKEAALLQFNSVLSLGDYAAGLAYMAGQSAYNLFKNYPQFPT
jgi:hypothetical protein